MFLAVLEKRSESPLLLTEDELELFVELHQALVMALVESLHLFTIQVVNSRQDLIHCLSQLMLSRTQFEFRHGRPAFDSDQQRFVSPASVTIAANAATGHKNR